MTWPTDLKVSMIIGAVLDGLFLVGGIIGLVVSILAVFSFENFGSAILMFLFMAVNVGAILIRFILFLSSLRKEFTPEANKKCRNVRLITTAFFIVEWIIFFAINGFLPNKWSIFVESGLTALIYSFSTRAEKPTEGYTAA